MPDIKILLIILSITDDGSRIRHTYPMPDVKTCQERLKERTLLPNQKGWCEYRVDY